MVRIEDDEKFLTQSHMEDCVESIEDIMIDALLREEQSGNIFLACITATGKTVSIFFQISNRSYFSNVHLRIFVIIIVLILWFFILIVVILLFFSGEGFLNPFFSTSTSLLAPSAFLSQASRRFVILSFLKLLNVNVYLINSCASC